MVIRCNFINRRKVLKFQRLKLPKIAENEVIVKYMISPINPADINTIQGVYPANPANQDGVMIGEMKD